MKKPGIIVKGNQEEELGRRLSDCIGKVIRDYEGMEVPVRADTVAGSTVQSLGFWWNPKQGRKEGRG